MGSANRSSCTSLYSLHVGVNSSYTASFGRDDDLKAFERLDKGLQTRLTIGRSTGKGGECSQYVSDGRSLQKGVEHARAEAVHAVVNTGHGVDDDGNSVGNVGEHLGFVQLIIHKVDAIIL